MAQYDERWRLELLARLGAERSYLLRQLWGLDEETLSTRPVTNGWTVKDILAHVAYWDGFNTDRMSKVADGRIQEIQTFDDDEAIDAHNAQRQQQFKEIPLENVVAMLLKERSGLYAMLERIPPEATHRRVHLANGRQIAMRIWVRRRWLHDAEHAQALVQWRKQLPDGIKGQRIGPKYILRALLQSTRKEFLLTADLVPEAERSSRPICGTWTLKDLIGHLTDWEGVGIDGLRQLAAGQTPEFSYSISLNFDEFNNSNAAARRDQSWDEVWHDFKENRQQLLALFDAMPESQLSRQFIAPWNQPSNGYRWTSIWFGHEHEHAIDVRRSLSISNWPKRLWRR
jgi:hypothetical protein